MLASTTKDFITKNTSRAAFCGDDLCEFDNQLSKVFDDADFVFFEVIKVVLKVDSQKDESQKPT